MVLGARLGARDRLIQLRTLKTSTSLEVMKKHETADETRRSLEEILELCLKTARRLRSVLEEGARHGLATKGTESDGSTPDEGIVIEG